MASPIDESMASPTRLPLRGEGSCGGGDPWVGKIPWRRAWQPTPVFLPGESHGHRSLAGYCPYALGVNPLPFQAGEPAGEKEPAPLPAPLCSHSTVGLLVSGRSQGDRRSASAHSLLIVHMALHDLCHNEFHVFSPPPCFWCPHPEES